MPTIEKKRGTIRITCPLCITTTTKVALGDWGLHLIDYHSATNLSADDERRSATLRAGSSFVSVIQNRIKWLKKYVCPLCTMAGGSHVALTQSALKTHLINFHGCSTV